MADDSQPVKKELTIADIISRLKAIRRFNLSTYKAGEFSFDTEREYDDNGEYIDGFEIDSLIRELQTSQIKQ